MKSIATKGAATAKPTARQHIHEPMTLGQRLADSVAASIGSWPFLIGQALFLFAWIVVNTAHLVAPHFDPPPYMGLNLMLSFQAAFTGPVLLIAANRAAAKDHARDEVEAQEVAQLVTINRQQLALLVVLLVWPLVIAATVLFRRRVTWLYPR